MTLQAQQYWNAIGSKKDFEDPLFMDKLVPFLSKSPAIIEYGCGYGRIIQNLKDQGYENLVGYDFAEAMIERGHKLNSHLDLRLLDKPNTIPCANESKDAVIMSTVLCCMVEESLQQQIMSEIDRVLKPHGVLYLSDFLICDHDKYKEKYAQGQRKFGTHGVYTTTENLTVRHFTSQHILKLLSQFDVQWFEQIDFKTMNNNPALTFHAIARKIAT